MVHDCLQLILSRTFGLVRLHGSVIHAPCMESRLWVLACAGAHGKLTCLGVSGWRDKMGPGPRLASRGQRAPAELCQLLRMRLAMSEEGCGCLTAHDKFGTTWASCRAWKLLIWGGMKAQVAALLRSGRPKRRRVRWRRKRMAQIIPGSKVQPHPLRHFSRRPPLSEMLKIWGPRLTGARGMF